MSKTWSGLAILLLILIAVLFNIKYLGEKTDIILGYTDRSEELAGDGDTNAAAEVLSKAVDAWNGMSGYTWIFLRHTDVDTAGEALYSLMDDLQKGEYTRASYRLLRTKISNILNMEKISIGSVF